MLLLESGVSSLLIDTTHDFFLFFLHDDMWGFQRWRRSSDGPDLRLVVFTKTSSLGGHMLDNSFQILILTNLPFI
jgi:hypothetical protein